ncbi:MAG: acyltransferase family protein, partial [Hominilimicola sp.]
MVRIAVSAAVVLFVAFMLSWRTKIARKGKFFDNYFSVDQTHSIKGMCAVFILLSHVCMYLAETFPSLFLFKYVGAIMVAGFFLVSGYGLQYGVMNKDNYLKGFFSKKMMSLAVPYYIINFFYITTNHMDLRSIILSLFGYNLWFMMAIVIFYTGFFLCNKIFGKKWASTAMTLFVIGYIIVMNRLHFGFWWYNSSLAFAAGIWICKLKESFTAFFAKKWGVKTLILIAVFAASYAWYCMYNHRETLLMLVVS